MATKTGTAGPDVLDGTSAADRLSGLDGDDYVYGYAGNDSLDGGTGDDWLDGGAGVDTMVGGNGDEVYIVTHLADLVVERADGGFDRIETKVSLTLPGNIEQGNFIGAGDGSVVGSALDNFIHGNDSDNTLVGGAGVDFLYGDGGNDSLVGGTGDDLLDGGAGVDTMVGGGGDDIYVVNTVSDLVVEAPGKGADWVETSVSLTLPDNIEGGYYTGPAGGSIVGNSFDNFITGNAFDNTLGGAGGIDTVSYAYEVNAVTVNLETGVASGSGADLLNDFENVEGGAAGDRLIGDAQANTLDGRAGADTLSGGLGGDTYHVNHVDDTVVEDSNAAVALPNAGSLDPHPLGNLIDTVIASITYTLANVDFVENLTLSGEAISGTGNELSNVLKGNRLANTLFGRSGNDTLEGARGRDSMDGGSGNDVIRGGGGRDTLTGGSGSDHYDFNFAINAITNVDRISAFSPTDDLIRLDHDIFTGLPTGILAGNRFHKGGGATAAANADERIIYNTNNGNLYFDPDGVGGTGSVLFAALSGAPALTAADFILY